MIAKSTWVAVFFSFLISTPSRAEIKNLYERILEEYDIHPPELTYGYPLWYQYDSLPITGIVFLKKDLDDLYRMDKITYVAEPTKENAEIIFNFSGEIEGYPKFYIVPDSSLSWIEVERFMRCLTLKFSSTNILLCGRVGKYVNIKMREESNIPGSPPYCGIILKERLTINSREELLYGGDFIEINELSHMMNKIYSFNPEINDDSFWRYRLTKSSCASEIERLNALSNEGTAFCPCWDYKVDKLRRKMKLISSFQDIDLFPDNGAIDLTVQSNATLPFVFKVLSSLNRAIFESRSERSQDLFNTCYFDLFSGHKLDECEFIHAESPDILSIDFCENESDERKFWSPPLEMQVYKTGYSDYTEIIICSF